MNQVKNYIKIFLEVSMDFAINIVAGAILNQK